jgi:hypothetical protein
MPVSKRENFKLGHYRRVVWMLEKQNSSLRSCYYQYAAMSVPVF